MRGEDDAVSVGLQRGGRQFDVHAGSLHTDAIDCRSPAITLPRQRRSVDVNEWLCSRSIAPLHGEPADRQRNGVRPPSRGGHSCRLHLPNRRRELLHRSREPNLPPLDGHPPWREKPSQLDPHRGEEDVEARFVRQANVDPAECYPREPGRHACDVD